MKHIILTRVKYCQKCFDKKQPSSNTVFLVYGSSSNTYHLHKSIGYGIRGFSPHIIMLDKVVGDVVKYLYSCCICNTEMFINNNRKHYIIFDDTLKEDTISLKEWNNWILFKNTGYEI